MGETQQAEGQETYQNIDWHEDNQIRRIIMMDDFTKIDLGPLLKSREFFCRLLAFIRHYRKIILS